MIRFTYESGDIHQNGHYRNYLETAAPLYENSNKLVVVVEGKRQVWYSRGKKIM